MSVIQLGYSIRQIPGHWRFCPTWICHSNHCHFLPKNAITIDYGCWENCSSIKINNYDCSLPLPFGRNVMRKRIIFYRWKDNKFERLARTWCSYYKNCIITLRENCWHFYFFHQVKRKNNVLINQLSSTNAILVHSVFWYDTRIASTDNDNRWSYPNPTI